MVVAIGCMSAPERKSYMCDECFMAMDCLYRMKDSKDKASCAALIESCRDAMKETTRINRLKYCKDSKPADMSERECRSWLNEK